MSAVTMAFKRARSEEQRETRRRAILDTAAAMLAEMPVSEVSLNELSRRVGLAKSNVLRYFESREAVLLELLDSASKEWLVDLDTRLAALDRTAPPVARVERIAHVIAGSLVDHRLLCELISVSAAVLERNVSTDVARQFKINSSNATSALARLTGAALPELSEPGALNFAASSLISVAGMWPLSNPSEAMLKVYEDPKYAAMRIGFADAIEQMLATLLVGSLTRWPA
jgi:AcrR family transcriptional regulator